MAFFKHPKLDQKLIRHYLLRAIFYVQFLRLKRKWNYSFRLSPLYLFSCRRYPVYMIIRILSKIHGKAKLVGEHLYTAITYLRTYFWQSNLVSNKHAFSGSISPIFIHTIVLWMLQVHENKDASLERSLWMVNI